MGGLCSAGEGAVPDGPKRRGVNTQTRKLSSQHSTNDADEAARGGDSDLDALPPLPKELPNRFQQDTKPSGADLPAIPASSVSNQASDTPEVERNTSVLAPDAESAPAQAAAPKTPASLQNSIARELHPSDSEKLRAIQRSDTNASSVSSMSDRRGSPYPNDLTPPTKPQRSPTMSPLVESLSPLVEDNMDEEEEAPTPVPTRQRSFSADAVQFVPGKASHTHPRRLSADAPTFVPQPSKENTQPRRLSADAPTFQPSKENTPANTPTVSTEVAFDAACDDKPSSALRDATREELEAACNEKRCVFLRIPGYPGGKGYRNPDDYSDTVGRVTSVCLTLETQPSAVNFPKGARIGFICFNSQEAAQTAIPKLSSCHLNGEADSQLHADIANPRTRGPRRGPTRTGNRRGRGGNRRRSRGRGRGRGRSYRGNN